MGLSQDEAECAATSPVERIAPAVGMVLHVIREAAVDLVNKASVVAVHEAGGPTVEPEQLLSEAIAA